MKGNLKEVTYSFYTSIGVSYGSTTWSSPQAPPWRILVCYYIPEPHPRPSFPTQSVRRKFWAGTLYLVCTLGGLGQFLSMSQEN